MEPHPGDEARSPGGDLAAQLREHPLGERVSLDLAVGDHLGQRRLVAQVGPDGAAHQPGESELGEAALGEVPDADHPDRGEVPGPAHPAEDLGQGVDEPLRDGVPGARPPEEHGGSVGDQLDRLADVDQLHGAATPVPVLIACTRRRWG